MKATAYLFPGQGSQVIGMAQDFYDAHAVVKTIFQMASDIADRDIPTLCFEGPIEELTETRNLQPAMTAAVLSCYRVFQKETDLEPSFFAGHSLGEYAALAAAGVIGDEDCLKLVTERGRLMQAEAEANPGAMAAVMKLEPTKVAEIVEELAQDHTICMANMNSPGQIVISGTEQAIEALKAPVKALRGRYSKLKVSGAWHSPLMNGALEPYSSVIDMVSFSDASAPVLLNVTGTPERAGFAIKEQMKLQMGKGVRWYPAILAAWESGVRSFVEFGPKGVLTKMLRTIVPDKETLEASFIDSLEKLETFKSSIQ